MRTTSRVLGGVGILLSVALGACSRSQTSVAHVWRADVTVAPMRSVIVFGAHMDEATRRSVEDAFVGALRGHEVAARPAYDLFPVAPEDPEKARALVKEHALEGILVLTMKNTYEKQTFYPGHYHPGFWSAYRMGPGAVGWGGPSYFYSPGYVETTEEVAFETTLWDARDDDRLVWAALTRTTNPSAGRDFVKSLTGTVVPAIARARLLPPAREP